MAKPPLQAGPMNMQRHAIFVALAIAISLPSWAQEPKQDKSQQAYVPRLNDIMIATQLRHFKLWHAGRVANWDLARYELDQIRASAEEATRFYPNIPAADVTALARSTDEVGHAIETKSGPKFEEAFNHLTAACNSCHAAAGFGFIKIREPRISPIETSPFSNESFSPQ